MNRNKLLVGERRVAGDGHEYTYAQFRRWYRCHAISKWDAAAQSSAIVATEHVAEAPQTVQDAVEQTDASTKSKQNTALRGSQSCIAIEKFKLWVQLNVSSCRKAVQQENKAKKRSQQHPNCKFYPQHFEQIKVQQFQGSILQLLEKGQRGLLRLNTFHYAGMASPAVHSASFKTLHLILQNGFNTEKDSDPTRHSSAKGWLRDKKGIFFGNLRKAWQYTDNPDNSSIAGEAIELGDSGRISYQGFYCSDWPSDHQDGGHWKRFGGDLDDEAFSAVDVPVVGAWVFQTTFRLYQFPTFSDPEWQKLAGAKCELLRASELQQQLQTPPNQPPEWTGLHAPPLIVPANAKPRDPRPPPTTVLATEHEAKAPQTASMKSTQNRPLRGRESGIAIEGCPKQEPSPKDEGTQRFLLCLPGKAMDQCQEDDGRNATHEAWYKYWLRLASKHHGGTSEHDDKRKHPTSDAASDDEDLTFNAIATEHGPKRLRSASDVITDDVNEQADLDKVGAELLLTSITDTLSTIPTCPVLMLPSAGKKSSEFQVSVKKRSISSAVGCLETVMLAYAQHTEAHETEALQMKCADACQAILSKATANHKSDNRKTRKTITNAFMTLYAKLRCKVALRRFSFYLDVFESSIAAQPNDRKIIAIVAGLAESNHWHARDAKRALISLCQRKCQTVPNNFARL